MSGSTRPKVICLGLGRSGSTINLKAALEILGFGPCLHMTEVLPDPELKSLETWSKVGDGKVSSEELREFLKDYGSCLDYPQAAYPEQMYAAFPDAKFILNTTDPVQWARVIETRVLPMVEGLQALGDKRTPKQTTFLEWINTGLLAGIQRGPLLERTLIDKMTAHNERVKKLIPPEKLLIYPQGDGWDGLVEWLEVPRPTIPYPHAPRNYFTPRISKYGLNPADNEMPVNQ